MHLVKRPRPRNFRSGNVCLSLDEAATIRPGDTLTVMKYHEDEILFSKVVTIEMIQRIEHWGDFCLMSYKD